MVLKDLGSWGFSLGKPLIVAGPCGVESAAQVMEVAASVKKSGAHILRGGIWKPRTRPGSFQGIGSTGLAWIAEAGRMYGLPVMVEVAAPAHVKEALHAGIQILWIGARTTVNPFLVQSIADELSGTDIPVMVKNPVSPDLELWIGALERLNKAGISRLAAIHRGFHMHGQSPYRNAPEWAIPIELKRRMPDLPLLCDPSHITGSAALIRQVSQTALDLNYDGLMIEVHPDPASALSDRHQQITPERFSEVLSQIVVRSATVDDVLFMSLLEELRETIDRVDREILIRISERMKLARKIGAYKKENKMTILQVQRWNEILSTRMKFGTDNELEQAFIARLYTLIHDESIRIQHEVMNSGEPAAKESLKN